MLATIESINNVVNNFIWGVPAMICIVGVGLLLSIRTGFLQIRKFPYAMKVTIGRMLKKREASDGALTPFQAVCTALAATVGTGNIAGVAGAIAIGGPGAVFWMWISALLGMCTKFSEVTLAVHFREKNAEGDLVGGPMYYIKNGLKKQWHWLAYLFAAFGVLTVFGTGNATQVNTITTAIDSALYNYGVISEQNVSTLNLVIGIILAVLIGLILLGGIKRIGQVAEKLVPFMAVIYIILAIGVVILNYRNIPTVFASIFKGAFSPASVTGGAVGSFFMSMKKGVSRGIFSNEAGLGTGSIAHACADTRKPGILWNIRSLCRYNCDLYTDGTCHSVQRRTGWIWRCGRCRTYDSWIYFHLRKLGIDIYGHCNVLLCIFYDHWMGTLWNTLCGVPAWYPRKQTIYDIVCTGSDCRRNYGTGTDVEYCRDI